MRILIILILFYSLIPQRERGLKTGFIFSLSYIIYVIENLELLELKILHQINNSKYKNCQGNQYPPSGYVGTAQHTPMRIVTP